MEGKSSKNIYAKMQFKVAPLNSKKNFSAWKTVMELVLKQKELWQYVVSSKEVDTVNELTARCLIITSVDEDMQLNLRNCNSAHIMWQLLLELHEPSVEVLLSKLMSYRFGSISKVNTGISDILYLRSRIASFGTNIRDDALMAIIQIACEKIKELESLTTYWSCSSCSARTLKGMIAQIRNQVATNQKLFVQIKYM